MAAPKSFRQPTGLSDVKILCAGVKLYSERSLLGRIHPEFLGRMRPPGLPGRCWKMRLEDKPEVVESFLRVVDYLADRHGLTVVDYEAVDQGFCKIPLEQSERLPYFEFCLQQKISLLVRLFAYQCRDELAEVAAAHALLEEQGRWLEDQEELLGNFDCQFYSKIKVGSTSPNPVLLQAFRRVWRGLQDSSDPESLAVLYPEMARSNRETLLRNLAAAGYSEKDLAEP